MAANPIYLSESILLAKIVKKFYSFIVKYKLFNALFNLLNICLITI